LVANIHRYDYNLTYAIMHFSKNCRRCFGKVWWTKTKNSKNNWV